MAMAPALISPYVANVHDQIGPLHDKKPSTWCRAWLRRGVRSCDSEYMHWVCAATCTNSSNTPAEQYKTGAVAMPSAIDLYSNARCQRSIEATAWKTRWLPSNKPSHVENLHQSQQTMRCCKQPCVSASSSNGSRPCCITCTPADSNQAL